MVLVWRIMNDLPNFPVIQYALFCSFDNWLCNLISENSYVLAALKQKYYKMHACADLQMLQYHHLVLIYGYIVLNIVTIYKFIYILVESQCDAEPVYSDSQYLQVCSGKNCNCSNIIINSVSYLSMSQLVCVKLALLYQDPVT